MLLFVENTIPVPFKEQWAWTMIFWQRYFKTFYRREMLFIIEFFAVYFEFVCQNNSVVIIEADKAFVKGLVI